MSFGGPFPRYPRTEIGLDALRAEYKDKIKRGKAKRERLEAEAEAAFARYPEPQPEEVQSLQVAESEFRAEADIISGTRMEILYPQGVKDVSLEEAWARLPSEISEELEGDLDKEVDLRKLTNPLNAFLIFTDEAGGIDPRHVTEAWAAYGRLQTVLAPPYAEKPEVELERRPGPIPETEQMVLGVEREQFIPPSPGIYPTNIGVVDLREDNTVWQDNKQIGTLDPQTGLVKPMELGEPEIELMVEPENKWWTKLGQEIWQNIPINPYFWKSPQEQAEIEQRQSLLEWAKAEGIENPEEHVNQLLAQETGLVVMRAATDEADYRPLPSSPVVYEGRGIPVTPGERVVGEWLIPIAAISWIPAFGAVQGWLAKHQIFWETGVQTLFRGGTLGRMVNATLKPLAWAEKTIAGLIKAPIKGVAVVAEKITERVFKPKFPELIEPKVYVEALKITHPERFKSKADVDAIFQELKQYNLYIREVAQNAPPPLMAGLTRQGLSHELFKLKPIKGGLYDVTVRAPYITPKAKGASMAIADVMQNPTAYNWVGKQGKIALNFTRAYHEVEAALLNFEKKSGILIKERWYPSGEYHVGRNVVAEVDARGNVVLERALRRGGLGTKLSAEKERIYLSQAEGIKGGKIYALPEESLNFRIQAAYDRAGGLEVKAQYLEMLSAKPSELLDVNIKQQFDALSRNYKDARYILNALQRAKRGETLPPATLAAITRRNPSITAIPKGKELTQLIKNTQASAEVAKAELRNFAPLYHRATAKAKEAAFTEGRIWAFPAMQNRIFTDILNPHNPNEVLMTGREVVTRLNAIFGAQRVNQAWATASQFSRVGVSLVAAMDGSFPFIQGPMTLGRDAANWVVGKPSAMWAKSTFEMLKTMVSPKYSADFLKRHAATFAEAPLLMQASSEFVWGYGVLSQWASKVPLVGGALTQIINQTYGRMGAGFSGAALASRTLLYENLKKSWLRHGGDLVELQLTANQLSGAVSLRYLGVSPQEAVRESALLFAPAFTRSWLMNIRDLLRGTMKAREVQKAMAGLFASMFGSYVTICALTGKEPKMNPAPQGVGGDGGQFLTIEVGGVNIGYPGWGVSLLRFAANLAAAVTTNPEALIKLDTANPIIRGVMAKGSPLVNLAKELATGRDYFGNRLEDPEDWVVMLADKVIPIAAQSFLEKTPESNVWVAVGAEIFGIKTYPVQPYEKLSRMEADLAEKYLDWEGDPYLWDELPHAFKDEIRRNNPDFAQLEKEVTEEWAMKRAADDERNLFIIKKEVEEKFVNDLVTLAQQVQSGVIKPDEYAKLVGDIRGTRATQRDLLWRLGDIGDPEGAEDYERYMIEEAPMEDRFMHTYWDYQGRLIEAQGTVIDWGVVHNSLDTWLDSIDPYYRDYILKYKDDWILDLPEPSQTIELVRREDIEYIKATGYWDIDPEAKTENIPYVEAGKIVKGGKNLRAIARGKDAKLDASLILWYSPEAVKHKDTPDILREQLAGLGIPRASLEGIAKYETTTRLEVAKSIAQAIQEDPDLAGAIKSAALTESQRLKLLKVYLQVYGQPKSGEFEEWLATDLRGILRQ